MALKLGDLTIEHPIMVGAGPWSSNAASIQKCIDNGASAVVTETITLDAYPTLCPHIYLDHQHLFNTRLFSHLQLEQWEEEIRKIDKKQSKLICSIWGSSTSEVSYLASKVQGIGADAIELSLFSPIGMRSHINVDRPEDISAFVKAVRNAVDIPVMVKLSYEIGNDPYIPKLISDAGILVVSAIDGLKGLVDIDVETMCAKMPTYGGLTGDPIRPMALATTAALKQNTTLHICSVGGISDYTHVLGYLMLGADAIQLASVIQRQGYGVIKKIKNDLLHWMDSHGYTSFSDIKGVALSSLIPFEDISHQPLIASFTGSTCPPDCSRCISTCLYDAISGTDKITIDPERCVGCGICADVCPENNINLVYP